MPLREIPLDALVPHPLNSNAMPPARFRALVAHLARTRRYPPLIVRPLPPFKPADEAPRVCGMESDADRAPAPRYQLLDGHHRARALRELGHAAARCEVWDVDDAEALLLLATLNRLEGEDDPRKRGALLAALRDAAAAAGGCAAEAAQRLALQLPDGRERIGKLIALRDPPAAPRAAPPPEEERPVATHFFLLPADRRALLARLRGLGGTREEALMSLVRASH